MSKLLVSVIIPIHNTEKYLVECLESVALQTYVNLEVILINDGSTDNSGALAANYASKDKRFKVIHKKNEGVSAAKNLGIKKARGHYITFIDSDDFISVDFVENLVKDLTKYHLHIVTTRKDITFIEKDNIEKIEIFEQSEALERIFYGKLEKSKNGVQMFDRQLLIDNNILFDSSKIVGEDFDFFINALSCCEKVAVDYRNMYYYRPNPSSVMNQTINKGLIDAVTNFYSVGVKLIYKYPHLQNAVDAKKFSDSISLTMRSYDDRETWKDECILLVSNINELKYQVLLDNKAMVKIRLAALIYCLFGNDIATIFLRRIKK